MPKSIDTITINSNIEMLPLVGSTLAKAFHGISVRTVADLLFYFPTRYMDYRKTVEIGAAVEGETITIIGKIKSISSSFGFRGRMPYTSAVIEDGTGKIQAIWFNQSYIGKQLPIGADVILSGKVGRYKQLQLTNPAYELIDAEVAKGNNLHTGRLVPIYRRGDLLPLRTMRRLIRSCLHTADELDDYIPKKVAQSQQLMSITEAVEILHFPETEEQINAARLRIAVDDILPQQIAIELKKEVSLGKSGFAIPTNVARLKKFLATLPFQLTPSQKRAVWDIFQDFESGKTMNRLLQGDVGSGKTIVALLSSLQIAQAGLQTALLAPTEILAKQHFETFQTLLENEFDAHHKPITIALYTRTFAIINGKEVTKTELQRQLALGVIAICIGTHALLQGTIEFKNLALVIIDEQHRFGVGQRSFLLVDEVIKESRSAKKQPHLLSMSATPIPRTLAMSIYADLDVSTLSHVPTGRKPIVTTIVPESQREHAYAYIRTEVSQGHQAFIVTPRVEDTDKSEVRSVKKEFERLQKIVFPKLRLGLLYGKMKGTDKDSIMADLAAGKLDILVATSVIEIGIDIPLATAIIIEGSERFGLAQLHQLRGRIGRNSFESRCFLFTTEDSHQETKRLQALSKTNDGFALAALDLEERGFGDLFGKQQSGFMFRFPHFITVKALTIARDIAQIIHGSVNKKVKKSRLYTLAQEYLTDIHNE